MQLGIADVALGRQDDAIGQSVLPVAVVGDNGVRDDWCRCHAVVLLNQGLDFVGRQNLERRTLRWT